MIVIVCLGKRNCMKGRRYYKVAPGYFWCYGYVHCHDCGDMMVLQTQTHIKTYSIVCFKHIQFIVFQLNFNKAIYLPIKYWECLENSEHNYNTCETYLYVHMEFWKGHFHQPLKMFFLLFLSITERNIKLIMLLSS